MSSKNNTNAGKAPETTGAAPVTSATPETTGAAPEGTQAPTMNPGPKTHQYFVPLLPGKHQPDLVGSLHGIPFQLPRGQWAELPEPIYKIVLEMQKNETKANQDYYGAQAQLLARAKEEEDRIIGK